MNGVNKAQITFAGEKSICNDGDFYLGANPFGPYKGGFSGYMNDL